MKVLKHNDLFLTNRGGKSYRAQVAQMKEYFGDGVLVDGVIEPDVEVFSPENGAGISAVSKYLKSSRITSVDFQDDLKTEFTVTDTTDINNPAFASPFLTADTSGGPFARTDYTLTTSTIRHVDTKIVTSYNKKSDSVGYDYPPSSYHSLGGEVPNVNIGSPAGGQLFEPGIQFEFPYYGFVRININANGADREQNIALWQSDDGVNWTLAIRCKQKQIDTTQPEYDSSIGFRGSYGCIQREGGTNANKWYPTSAELNVFLDFEPNSTGVASNPDLQYFKVGDLVQEDYKNVQGNVMYMVTDAGGGFFDDPLFTEYNSKASDIFDCNKTNPGNSYIRRTNAWCEMEFKYPLTPTKGIWTRCGDWSDANVYDLYINEGYIGTFQTTFTAATPYFVDYTNPIKKIKVVGRAGVLLREFHVDEDDLAHKVCGTLVETLPQEARVVSVNQSTNSMIVSGGNWLGSDGSSSGEPADRETVVTYDIKAGYGDIESINGLKITVRNNGDRDNRWIGPNKAGKNFFAGTPIQITDGQLLPEDVVFTSQNGSTVKYTAVPSESVDLAKRHWYLRSSDTENGLKSQAFTKYTETNIAVEGQDPGKWRSAPILEENKFYEVACQYEDEEGKLEPLTFNINSGVNVGNVFKTSAKIKSDPITYTGKTYYYEKEHRIIRGEEIVKRFGKQPGAIPELGILEVTEELRGPVLGFRRVGDKVQPVYDLTPKVEDLLDRLGL